MAAGHSDNSPKSILFRAGGIFWGLPVVPSPNACRGHTFGPPNQVSLPGRTIMNEDALNVSVRKFLKKLGVTAQREMEKAVRDAVASGQLKGGEKLPAKAVVPLGGVDIRFEIDGDIEFA